MPEDTAKPCFMIGAIGRPSSKGRKRSDALLWHVVRPALEPLGFRVERGDTLTEAGDITHQVWEHVVSDPLVVADLTGTTPNVLYELSIRHALGKPVIQLVADADAVPFNLVALRTVVVDDRDAKSMTAAAEAVHGHAEELDEAGRLPAAPIQLPGRDLATLLAGVTRLIWPEARNDPTQFLKETAAALRKFRQTRSEAERVEQLNMIQMSLDLWIQGRERARL